MSGKAGSIVRHFRKNKRVTVAEAYREATERKQLLIRNAGETHNRLTFIAHAMRELLRDDKFVSLLMTENLDTIPRKLAAHMERRGLDGEKIEAPARDKGVSAQAGKDQTPRARSLPRSGRVT